jgi:hypothetical protein
MEPEEQMIWTVRSCDTIFCCETLLASAEQLREDSYVAHSSHSNQ